MKTYPAPNSKHALCVTEVMTCDELRGVDVSSVTSHTFDRKTSFRSPDGGNPIKRNLRRLGKLNLSQKHNFSLDYKNVLV